MGVLYEHWRPDLNECFYVGISWANEDTRPYDLSPRNPHHGNVLDKLRKKGLNVDVRIQARGLSKDELLEIEPLQIKYWREILGRKLTNITLGGDGIQLTWTPKLRKKHGDKMRVVMAIPKNKEKRQLKAKEFMSIPEIKERHRKAVTEAANRPEVKARNRKIQRVAQNRPEVKQRKSESQRIAMSNFVTKQKHKEALKFALNSLEVKEKRKAAEETPERKLLRSITQRKVSEQKSCAMKKTLALISAEERSVRTKKGWETRRRNKGIGNDTFV